MAHSRLILLGIEVTVRTNVITSTNDPLGLSQLDVVGAVSQRKTLPMRMAPACPSTHTILATTAVTDGTTFGP